MEQTLQDINHYARIISGCESINYVNNNGGKLSDDGRYAQSVLRLHAQDEFGALAGNESILAGIKKGAKKLKEWIASLVKAVKEFITGSQKKKKDFEAEYKAVKAKYDKLPAEKKESVDTKAKPIMTNFGQVFQRIVDKLKKAKEEAKGEDFKKLGYTPNLDTAITDMQHAVARCEDANWFMAATSLKLASGRLDAELNAVNTKLSAFANGEETADKNSTASKIAAWVNTTTAINHSMVMNMGGLAKRGTDWLDSFMDGKEE